MIMNNTNSKLKTLFTLLFFLFCTSAFSQNTDKQGNITKRRYFYVYTDAQTSEAGVGYTHHLYSNTIQVVDSYGSIKTKVLSQWMDVIQVNHPDLIMLYGQDNIYRRSYVWEFDTREQAEKDKRSTMAESSEKEAKILGVSFTYYTAE